MKYTLTKGKFMEEVKKRVSIQMGKDYHINLRKVVRNNGKCIDTITFVRKNDNIAPVVHLDGFFERFLGGVTLEEVVLEIIGRYQSHQNNVTIDVEELKQFESIKNRIVMKLVNYKKNKKLLMDVPHERIQDLAIVAYIRYDAAEQGYPSILIHNCNLELWDVSSKEVLTYAKENSQKYFPAIITDMGTILREFMDSGQLGEMENNDYEQGIYILTNSISVNGAACFLYDGVLKQFATKHGTDVIILPSSIHESLLLPKREEFEVAYLREMVAQINKWEVPAEEVLSDNVYIYELESDSIKIME